MHGVPWGNDALGKAWGLCIRLGPQSTNQNHAKSDPPRPLSRLDRGLYNGYPRTPYTFDRFRDSFCRSSFRFDPNSRKSTSTCGRRAALQFCFRGGPAAWLGAARLAQRLQFGVRRAYARVRPKSEDDDGRFLLCVAIARARPATRRKTPNPTQHCCARSVVHEAHRYIEQEPPQRCVGHRRTLPTKRRVPFDAAHARKRIQS